MNFLEKYKTDALRTESVIDKLNGNSDFLIEALSAFTAITEVLDGIKKMSFYGKRDKLDATLRMNLLSLQENVDQLLQMESSGEYKKDTGDLSHVHPRLFHGIVGMSTESGELASVLLNNIIDAESQVDAVNVHEEIGDTSWYQAILHDHLGLDWEQGLTNNIDKLRERFPDKFTEYDAEVRDLEAERLILERKFGTIDVSADGTVNFMGTFDISCDDPIRIHGKSE